MDELSKVDKLLMQALSPADWFTRSEIAGRMGAQGYNQNDVKRLEGLVSAGRVERRERPLGKAKVAFEYRLKS